MLKILKFNTKDQNVWFTADLHRGHNKEFIYKKRGFNSLQDHDNHIITTINQLVKLDDILFSVGDLTLNTTEEQFQEFIGQINCKNIYVHFGNHANPMAKIYKREMEKVWNQLGGLHGAEIYPFRYKNLVFVGDYLEMWVDKQFIVTFHYPLSVFNYMKHNAWALVGHAHHSFQGSLPSNPNQKILDVGWDGYLRPLSFDEIKQIMDKKQYIAVDDHH